MPSDAVKVKAFDVETITMPRVLVFAVTALAVVAGASFAPASAQAAVCADYANQKEAQDAADTLDADGDGLFCESLPCPCSEAKQQDAPKNVKTDKTYTYRGRITQVVDGDTLKVKYNGRVKIVRVIGGLSRVSTATDQIEHVSDGDTVVLKAVGKTRLIGIDTPEVFNTPECFGKQASAFTKQLLPSGTKVRLWWDSEPTDKYGRMLLYLQLPDGRLVNDLLASKGMAVTLTIPPNVGRADRLRALAKKARASKLGLWSPQTCNGNPDLPASGDN